MNRADLDRLKAERAEVQRMLADIPEEQVIDRGSLQYRLDELEESIAAAGVIPAPAKAVITFRGKPVIGAHGIFYDFGTKAVSHFADAVAKLAVPADKALGERGVIPGKSRLLITNAAVGSFGFELEEEPTNGLSGDEPSPTAMAMKQVAEILEGARRSDDELAASIADAQPRAVSSVRDFLTLLANNEAVSSVSVGDRVVRFSHIAEVRQSLERLDVGNVREETRPFQGRFLGFLPHRRTFEFLPDGQEDPIVGKVSQGIEGVESINAHLGQATSVQLKVTRVGEGRPSYALAEVPKW